MSKLVAAYAEVLRDGRWTLARPKESDPDDLDPDTNEPFPPELVDEFWRAGIGTQNHAFFAMLSPWGNPAYQLAPVTEGRGVPPDLCGEILEYIEECEHDLGRYAVTWWAPSWMLLRELIDFDWSGWEREGGTEHRELIASLAELGDADKVRLVVWLEH